MLRDIFARIFGSAEYSGTSNKSPCNILVIGKTGVGKSSLINYLAGRKCAKVGVGRPVTSRDDIQAYDINFNGVSARMFDSWGIEADKVQDWKDRIKKVTGSAGENGSDGVCWFHTIVYCVSLGNGRVDDLDIDLIRFFKEEGYSMVVALTQGDRATDEDVSSIHDALPDEVVSVITSSGGTGRYGRIKPFGKDELLRAIIQESLRNLPSRTYKFGDKEIEKWERSMLDGLKQKDVSRFSNDPVVDWIKRESRAFGDQLGKAVEGFVAGELSILNAWSCSMSAANADCNVDVSMPIADTSFSFGEAVLAFAFAPIVLFGALAYGVICGVEHEREKLRRMIYSASSQMRKYLKSQCDVMRSAA